MSATFVYLSNVIMESDSPFLLSSLDIPSATDVSFCDRAFMYVDNSEIKSVHSLRTLIDRRLSYPQTVPCVVILLFVESRHCLDSSSMFICHCGSILLIHSLHYCQ